MVELSGDPHARSIAQVERHGVSDGVLLAAFALSGAAALSYEVIWTRALSIVLGSTTYALSSMLATFMLGLAVGGMVGGRLADRPGGPLGRLGACEIGIGLAGIASHALIRLLPAAYLGAYRAFHLDGTLFFAVQIALCSAVMLAPTVLMGMTFPLAVRALATDAARIGTTVGKVYGFNTLGSVLGSLLAGFALVPLLGLRGATFVAAATNLAIGLLFLFVQRARARWAGVAAAGAASLLALSVGGMSGGEREWAVANFFRAGKFLSGGSYASIVEQDRQELQQVFARNGVEGFVSVYRTADGRLVVQNGGKIEGTSARDEPNTLLLAYLPIAAHASPRRMLVIGLGAGVTLGAARRELPDVELVEISQGVIDGIRRAGAPGLLDAVTVHRDDARNFLLRSDTRYDVISSEPSYPTEFAVGNLFTRDYFELAASRLADGGIYCQWLPYYMLTNDDVTMMLKTFGLVFPEAMLWKLPGSLDLIVLGSRRPFARAPEAIAEEVRKRFAAPAPEFVLSRGPAEIREIAARAGVPVNTDDHPILEFRVARNFRIGRLALVER